jgi:hypothetical protein
MTAKRTRPVCFCLFNFGKIDAIRPTIHCFAAISVTATGGFRQVTLSNTPRGRSSSRQISRKCTSRWALACVTVPAPNAGSAECRRGVRRTGCDNPAPSGRTAIHQTELRLGDRRHRRISGFERSPNLMECSPVQILHRRYAEVPMKRVTKCTLRNTSCNGELFQ